MYTDQDVSPHCLYTYYFTNEPQNKLKSISFICLNYLLVLPTGKNSKSPIPSLIEHWQMTSQYYLRFVGQCCNEKEWKTSPNMGGLIVCCNKTCGILIYIPEIVLKSIYFFQEFPVWYIIWSKYFHYLWEKQDDVLA